MPSSDLYSRSYAVRVWLFLFARSFHMLRTQEGMIRTFRDIGTLSVHYIPGYVLTTTGGFPLTSHSPNIGMNQMLISFPEQPSHYWGLEVTPVAQFDQRADIVVEHGPAIKKWLQSLPLFSDSSGVEGFMRRYRIQHKPCSKKAVPNTFDSLVELILKGYDYEMYWAEWLETRKAAKKARKT